MKSLFNFTPKFKRVLYLGYLFEIVQLNLRQPNPLNKVLKTLFNQARQ